MASPQTPSPAPAASARVLLVLTGLTLAAIAAVAAMIWRSGRQDEQVVAVIEQPAPTNRVNVHEVTDAIGRRDVTAEAGRRYRVRIDDESRDSAAGVAHIGGMVVFVPGAKRGEEAVIEVTRLKRSTAEAVVVERLAAPAQPAAPARAEPVPAPAAPPVGPVYTAVVESVGRKGDGIVKLDGKVVFLPGVQQGERVAFAIAEDRDKHAVGQVIRREPAAAPAAPPAAPSATPPAAAAAAPAEHKADLVQPGAQFDIEVAEDSRERPGREGVARIDGLVVFVPGTKPGDKVRVRITKRMPRFAAAEVVTGP